MKLVYTYASWIPKMTYELDEALEATTNMLLPHVFRTQREADFFTAYAMVKGIKVNAYTKRTMPKQNRMRTILHLWAKLPDL